MYLMKKFMVGLLAVVMLTVSLNATVFGGGISSQTYTCDGRVVGAYLSILENWDGDAQYIVYDIDKDGTPELIIESGVAAESILNFYTFNGGETKWLGSKEGSHTSLATVPNKNGILRTSAHSSFQHVSLISVKDGGIEETEVFAETLTPDEYIEHGYYEPNYFFDGAEDLNFCEKSDLSALKKIKYAESITPDYSLFVDKYIKTLTEFADSNQYARFTFGYVNGDNIPDAIVSTSAAHAGQVRFFVSVGGDIQKVSFQSNDNTFDGFGQYGQAKYIPRKSKIYSYSMYRGVEENNYYQINGGKAILTSDSSGGFVLTPSYNSAYVIHAQTIRTAFEQVITSGANDTNTTTFSTADFDLGMAKGIQYFNNGQYYEARDEFQWFCDDNWGKMNEGQQQYALDYLSNAKEKVAEIEKENSRLTQQQFDDGMRKGIDYFNKGLWKDARNEFQWFCDGNWWRMNSGQRKYALDYLGAAKQNFQAATGWSDISESQKLKNRLGIIKVHLDYLEMMESLKKNGLID